METLATITTEPRQVLRPVAPRLRRRRRRDRVVGYWALRAALAFAGTLPDCALFGFSHLARWAAPLDRPHWRTSLSNIKRALGREYSETELRNIARAAFGNLALSTLEMARIFAGRPVPDDSHIDVVGMEHFERVASERKGIIVFTGHLGNWELSGAWFARLGYPVAAVARLQPNPRINRLLMSSRQGLGITIIPKRCPWAVIRSFLSDNYTIAFLADQYGGTSGVAVSFFGMDTTAPKGPILTALRTGAPVLPIFMVRQGHSLRHTAYFEPPIELERTGNLKRDLQINTQKAINVLEGYVRRYPEQWLWMHRRWRQKVACPGLSYESFR